MSKTFASLSVRNYRYYFFGGLLANTGTWIGRTSQDWLVLTMLTDHNSTDLGIVTALQFLPVVLLAPIAGAITDRYRKRNILFATQSALLVTSAILAVLMVTGTVQLWHVYLLALAQGVATALDNPTRQAFVSEMVDREHLSNAVGLNATSFNAARLIGPGIAGLMIAAFGVGPTQIINAVSFVAVLFALRAMRLDELSPAPQQHGKGKIREGIGYVRHRPDIMLIMFIVFMLGTFGMNFQVTIALMATTVFHKGAAEYGLLGSVMAIGSLAAALAAARRQRPRLRIILVALVGFTIFSAVAALAPSYALFALFLIPTGLFAITVLNTSNATVQLSVEPEFRGRVMALYMAIFMGGTPIGSPIIGWIGTVLGARWTILIGSIACVLTVVAALAYLRRGYQIRLLRGAGHVPSVQVTARPSVVEQPALERVA